MSISERTIPTAEESAESQYLTANEVPKDSTGHPNIYTLICSVLTVEEAVDIAWEAVYATTSTSSNAYGVMRSGVTRAVRTALQRSR
ncbi:MAG: hypothetical protein ACREBU_26385 [Nitrososphaera sp.]